jgi:tetratricopeptide (TPR) repeat protein
VRLAPQVGEPHSLLGVVCLRSGHYEQARREVERALELDATLAQSHYVLACVYTKSGDFDKALENLRAWLAAQPQFAAYADTCTEFAPLREPTQFQESFRRLVADAAAKYNALEPHHEHTDQTH